MEKLKLESPDITKNNIEVIAKLFPNVITEGKDDNGEIIKVVDFEKLKQELSDSIVDSDESYDFTWVGKKESMLEANRPIRKTLRPVRESSVDWENTKNIYIEGDNLEALKLLQESYLGKISVIYIDPPYNKGKDFIYKDARQIDKNEYAEMNTIRDESENILFQNTETNGRFHSDWCSMIYPRLKLARNLLSDDGVIFISIDDDEVRNLKNICDEIFGANNFLAQFVYEKTQHFGRQKLNTYSNVDYVICYAKNKYSDNLKELLVEKVSSELADAPLYNASNNPSVLTFPANTVKFNMKDGTYSKTTSEDYELLNPVKVVNSKNENDFQLRFRSRWSAQTVLDEIQKGTTYWVKTETFAIRAIYGDGKTTNVAPKQIIFTNDANPHCAYSRFNERVDTNEKATSDLETLMGKKVFSYPKSVPLIKYLISLLFNYNKDNYDSDFIVLDFFSGSGTTAQACMELNLSDNGKRKFILVQLPENLEENLNYATNNDKPIVQNAIDLCDELHKPRVITTVSEERLRKAGEKLQKENPDKNIDTGFRVFKIDDTNMKDVYYAPKDYNKSLLEQMTSNIKDGRTDEDLLYGVLLDWGVELSLPHKVETIEGKRIHIVNDNNVSPDLIACFEEDVPETVVREIAKKKPTRVVFRDGSFNTDDHKINVEEIFKMIAPNTTIKVI